MNIANTEQVVNVVYPSVNFSEIFYDNVSSLSVRETGVNGDHYSTHYDSGHMDPSWTKMTHNTFHPDRANGLQSITPDDLQYFTCHRSNHHPKIFQSVRPGHHCHNHRGTPKCPLCFTVGEDKVTLMIRR